MNIDSLSKVALLIENMSRFEIKFKVEKITIISACQSAMLPYQQKLNFFQYLEENTKH